MFKLTVKMKYSEELISLLFPQKLSTLSELEEKYPQRQISDGGIVTRFGPSPTGFMHIGGVYIATIAKNLAKQTNGVYFIRIEDTDQKRKVADFQSHFDETFNYFDIKSDENDSNALWGPYTQSERQIIYLSCVKYLLQIGRAYPCFCTKEMLEEQTEKQKEAKLDIGYYGKWAICRNFSTDEVEKRMKSGEPFVIRFRSESNGSQIEFNDLIRGTIKMNDNINDVVILKSSSEELPLPTYHLAHAVDDHFMRVNLVLRSEEWLPSVPIHLQLFDALGFDRIPYAHIAPLMKNDGKSRRKLSKRKDPEASVVYYMENGYPAQAVISFLKGLANSRLMDIPTSENLSEAIKLNELQKSGALIDMEKLSHVSANYIATLSASQIYDKLIVWSREHDKDLYNLIQNRKEYLLKVIDADRFNNGKVRKDLYRWADFKALHGFFFVEVFQVLSNIDERLNDFSKELITKLATEFINHYEEGNDNAEWFENIKKIAKKANFAINNKDFKENPTMYNGTIKEATQLLRIAITGKSNSPSLYEVGKVIGKDEVIRRVNALL